MTRQEIKELNDIRPYCFQTDWEQKWYEIGLIDGVDVTESDILCEWEKIRSQYSQKTFSLDDVDKIIRNLTQQAP